MHARVAAEKLDGPESSRIEIWKVGCNGGVGEKPFGDTSYDRCGGVGVVVVGG